MYTGNYVILLTVTVKPECVDDFVKVAMANVENSRKEPGVLAFDLVRSKDDPAEFYIVEVYTSPEDHGSHRETEHYKEFKEKVAPLLPHPYRAVYGTSV